MCFVTGPSHPRIWSWMAKPSWASTRMAWSSDKIHPIIFKLYYNTTICIQNAGKNTEQRKNTLVNRLVLWAGGHHLQFMPIIYSQLTRWNHGIKFLNFACKFSWILPLKWAIVCEDRSSSFGAVGHNRRKNCARPSLLCCITHANENYVGHCDVTQQRR